MKLSEIKVGKTFKIEYEEFIVLEQCENSTKCLSKDLVAEKVFDDDTSNFAKSSMYEYLNGEYLRRLSKKVGKENIIEHEVDLTMDTGHKDYGTCKAKISLLTADMFREYVDILDKYNPGEWWWLATADNRQWKYGVRIVGNVGALGSYDCDLHNCDLLDFYDCDPCDNRSGGVRPFLIFNSEIIVSD